MRRQSRELALQILFQTEFTPQIPYSQFLEVFEKSLSDDLIQYADMLVKGVRGNLEQIDTLIQNSSRHWKLERMALVDKNMLRLGIYEMKIMPNPMSPSIVINEAVELAKIYGSSDSGSFVNAILDNIAKAKA